MIVAIKDGRIVAAADLVSECEDAVLEARPWIGEGQVRYRPASPALAKAIEGGAALESLDIVVGQTADLADHDIRTIRAHVLSAIAR